jgi:hypothetical protein
MQEIRVALKAKPEQGQPTPSRKISNRSWREDILGILNEEQRKKIKELKQKKNKSKIYKEFDLE